MFSWPAQSISRHFVIYENVFNHKLKDYHIERSRFKSIYYQMREKLVAVNQNFKDANPMHNKQGKSSRPETIVLGYGKKYRSLATLSRRTKALR